MGEKGVQTGTGGKVTQTGNDEKTAQTQNGEKIVQIRNGGTTAQVSDQGAQLMGLERNGLQYLWQGDARWWPRRAPVLFPIVGSLRGDRAMTEAGPAPMSQHGVARNFRHEVLEQRDDSVTFELTAGPQTRKLYPYDFRLRMTYALDADGVLSQRFWVRNDDGLPMPFTVGGHPAFNVPVDPASGERFEDYELVFCEPWAYESPALGADRLLHWDERFPVADGTAAVPLARSLFDHDTVVLEDVPGRTLTLRGTKTGRGVRVDFPGFHYCGVWSAPPDAPFVALEPWTGVATGTDESDRLEEKRGMVRLAPGDVFEREFTVTLL